MVTKRGGIAVYQKCDFDPKSNFVAKQQTEGQRVHKVTTVAEYSKDDYSRSLVVKHLCNNGYCN